MCKGEETGLSGSVGAQWAGNHESAEVPVSMVLLFSPAVGTARKWMAKSSLAVDWPGRYSGRAIFPPSPFYLGQEVSSEGVAV